MLLIYQQLPLLVVFLYQHTGSEGSWKLTVPYPGKQVGLASDGTTWGLDTIGRIWQLVQNSKGGWDGTGPGGGAGRVFLNISCGSATILWAVGTDGQYWKYTGSTWTQAAPGTGKQVSAASDGTVWSIGTDNNVYRLVSNVWTPLLV